MINEIEAFTAWKNGESVEIFDESGVWHPLRRDHGLCVFDSNGRVKFRLKPQTLKIMIEVPKPFEPKDGDRAWVLSNTDERGYNFCDGDYDIHCMYGAWRTEEEIKQVVAELRKLKCTTWNTGIIFSIVLY